MVVRDLIEVIDPGKPVIICKGGEMRGLFPGRFIPSMYYDENIQLITCDEKQEGLKVYIGKEGEV